MIQLEYPRVARSISFALFILMLLSSIACSEEIGGFTEKDWHIWRWYELIQVHDDGKVDVWVKIKFEFLNTTVTHPFILELELPSNVKNLHIYPKEGVPERKFLSYTLVDNELRIKLNPSVAKTYRFYEVAFHYTAENVAIKKRGQIWDSFNEWILNLEIDANPLIPSYMKYEAIRIFIILPDDASVHRMQPSLDYLSTKEFYKAGNFGKFEEIVYDSWNVSEIAKYPLPVKVAVKIGQPILEYAGRQFPRDVNIEYVTPNTLIGPLSFFAILSGLVSSLLTIVSAAYKHIKRK